MNALLLPGLDGGNLLGFLAALGTLRTATRIWPQESLRMDWTPAEGAWCPRLVTERGLGPEELITELAERLEETEKLSALNLGDNLTMDTGAFRAALEQAVRNADAANREDLDWLAAFGTEAIQSTANGKPTGQIADSAFRTMSGAGHQHFLGSMRQFIADTQACHLEKSLFHAWHYDDPLEKHSMRWDPAEDVRYALRWDNPSGDRNRKTGGSMWGANRLALEALPLFPVAPVGKQLQTTGFSEHKGQRPRITWPLWGVLAPVETVRSLLGLRLLQDTHPDRERLTAYGVVEVFRAERITQGKFRNFTPALPA